MYIIYIGYIYILYIIYYIFLHIFYFLYIWVNYNNLTATSLESWSIRGIIPIWSFFRLVTHIIICPDIWYCHSVFYVSLPYITFQFLCIIALHNISCTDIFLCSSIFDGRNLDIPAPELQHVRRGVDL